MRKIQKIMAGLMTFVLAASLLPAPALAAVGEVLTETVIQPSMSVGYLNAESYGEVAIVRENVYYVPDTQETFETFNEIPEAYRDIEKYMWRPYQIVKLSGDTLERVGDYYHSLEGPSASGYIIATDFTGYDSVIDYQGNEIFNYGQSAYIYNLTDDGYVLMYPYEDFGSTVSKMVNLNTGTVTDYGNLPGNIGPCNNDRIWVYHGAPGQCYTPAGTLAFEGWYDIPRTFSHGYAVTVVGDVYQIIDTDGVQVGLFDAVDFGRFSAEGLMPVKNAQNLWGYIDITGKEKIAFQYDDARDFINGYAVVSKGSMTYVIDAENNVQFSTGDVMLGQITNVSNTGLIWFATKIDVYYNSPQKITEITMNRLQTVTPKTKLPRGIQYVPYETTISGGGELAVDSELPPGLTLENGILAGMPTEYGTFFFTIGGTDYSLTFLEHTIQDDAAVWNANDGTSGDGAGYAIEVAIPSQDGMTVLGAPNDTWDIGSNAWDNETMEFKSEGPFAEFDKLWLDGTELTRSENAELSDGNDYYAEEGSTRLTIRTQTLQNKGDGTHTISAQFKGESDNKLHYSTQNYQLGQSSTTDPGMTNPGTTNPGTTNPAPIYPGNNAYYPSAPVSHSVSVPSTVGGRIIADPASASAGQTVKLTAVPDAGYQLDNLSVFDKDGNKLILNQNSTTEFSFTMPSGGVTIQGSFRPLSAALPFWDVSASAWYFDAVRYVYQHGLMRGVSEDSFQPDADTTRAMFVTVLYRYSGETDEGAEWYSSARDWAIGRRILLGDENGDLKLFSSITREELLTMLYRYTESPAVTGQLSAPDAASVSDWARDAMVWAVQTGLVEGFGDGTIRPNVTATRAEIAAFFMRFMEK